MFKKLTCFLLSGAVTASALFTGCGTENNLNETGSNAENRSALSLSNGNTPSEDVKIADGNTCTVNINGEIDITGDGAWYEGNVLTITRGGEYTLSGNISNGYIYIEADENVKLILNGLSVYNNNGAALYCYKAKNLYIELTEGSENTLSDCANYSFNGQNESAEKNEPNAALYSKSDLIICGSGSLTVNGSYGLGIRCNDDLTIENGNISVSAASNGIRGNDSVVIEGGNIKVNAEKDGIKSTNDTDEGKGYILISGGNVDITAGEDGVQAETDLSVTGGEISVTTYGEVAQGGSDGGFGGFGGFFGRRSASDNGTYVLNSELIYNDTNNIAQQESTSSVSEDATSKGIKCGGNMTLTGGKITIDSTDHCVHSEGTLAISNGEFTLSSSMGKGISAHGSLQIDGGKIDVLQSTEGIESKSVFTVNGGEITIEASDDGLNSGGGSDSRFFGGSDASDGEHDMYLNGGYIYINASGDGIDSNGNITVNGGTIIVNGPTSGGDGALDSGDRGNTITVNGGTLIAAGSMQMAENPGSTSAQNCLCASVSLNAGETLAVQDTSGKNIAVFTVKKQAQHIVFSSPDIKTGETYTFYTGVTAEGENKNGLYSENAVVTNCDNAACTMTVNSSVTSSGGNSGFGGFGGGFRGNRDFGDNGGNPADGNGFGGSSANDNGFDGTPPDDNGFGGNPPSGGGFDGNPPNDNGFDVTPPDGEGFGGTPPDRNGNIFNDADAGGEGLAV